MEEKELEDGRHAALASATRQCTSYHRPINSYCVPAASLETSSSTLGRWAVGTWDSNIIRRSVFAKQSDNLNAHTIVLGPLSNCIRTHFTLRLLPPCFVETNRPTVQQSNSRLQTRIEPRRLLDHGAYLQSAAALRAA